MRLIVFITVILSVNICFAQQEPLFTLFWNNFSVFNPASTGLLYKNYFSINARTELREYEVNPQAISLVYDYNFDKINSGIGLNYYFDKIGYIKTHKINLNYSYHFQFDNNSKLSIGFAISYARLSIDFSKFTILVPPPPKYHTLTTDDLIDINLGTNYKTDKFLIGIGVSQLEQSEYKKFNSKIQRQYYLNCSYNIRVGNRYELIPTVYLRRFNKYDIFDYNLLIFYKEQFWIGACYRTSKTYAGMFGYDINKRYRIGYSFEHTFSNFNQKLNSHEIIFAMMLK